MAERVAHRVEVLAAVTEALNADTATAWESRLRPLGVPAAAVRTLPEALSATPEMIVTAGGFRLVASPVRIAGYDPVYGPPPRLGEHGPAGPRPPHS
jgi:crotonobetainyl-CoA:carnitine CoA-transferase CaiB-like acyl-CoA transferase